VDEDFLDLRLVSAIFGRVDEVNIYYFERLTPEFESAMEALNGVRKVEVYENDFFGISTRVMRKPRKQLGKKTASELLPPSPQFHRLRNWSLAIAG